MTDTFTPIHNDVLEALMKIRLSPAETCVLFAIWRKTYGFRDGRLQRKRFDYLSLSQLQNMTGLPKTSLCRALSSLKSKHMIYRQAFKTGFSKDFMKVTSTKNGTTENGTVPKMVLGSTKNGTSASTENGTYKRNNTKETNTKEKRPEIKKGLEYEENRTSHSNESHSKIDPEIEREFSLAYVKMITKDPSVQSLKADWPKEKKEFFSWWLSQRIFN